jgi:thiol-disulfide isomerase/thioredoxin
MSARSRSFFLLLLFTISALWAQPPRAVQARDNKPVLAVVYADWCPYCQKLKPVLVLLNDKYKGKIHFLHLDVTSPEKAAASRMEAVQFGLGAFFDKHRNETSLIMIQDAAGHEVFSAVHDYDFQHYANVLDQQLAALTK